MFRQRGVPPQIFRGRCQVSQVLWWPRPQAAQVVGTGAQAGWGDHGGGQHGAQGAGGWWGALTAHTQGHLVFIAAIHSVHVGEVPLWV